MSFNQTSYFQEPRSVSQSYSMNNTSEFGGASQGFAINAGNGFAGSSSFTTSVPSSFVSSTDFSASSFGMPRRESMAAPIFSMNSASGFGGAAAGSYFNAQQNAASAATSSIAQDLLRMSGGNTQYVSQIENAILGAQGEPLNINENQEITVLGNRGIFANRSEVMGWKGIIPIEQYQVNEDANPEVMNKKVTTKLEYIQELAIRYLRPPTPPAPGEIVVQQEGNTLTPPAPPLVVRQVPPRPDTPEPLILREAPPQPPQPIGRKLISISGKRLPPPPRKIVVERLAPIPTKPQSVIVERWMPYVQGKRRVIFQKGPADPVIVKPRNVIVQWEAPAVIVKTEIKYLGVVRANPAEYVSQYGASLKLAKDLPQYVLDIKTPDGLVLAANYKAPSILELEGDVSAFKLVDLEREGLGDYRSYLQRLGVIEGAVNSSVNSSLNAIIDEIFRSVDTNNSGSIAIAEAERLLLRLNSRLGRSYGEDDVKKFFSTLDVNGDGTLSLVEFRQAFLRLA